MDRNKHSVAIDTKIFLIARSIAAKEKLSAAAYVNRLLYEKFKAEGLLQDEPNEPPEELKHLFTQNDNPSPKIGLSFDAPGGFVTGTSE